MEVVLINKKFTFNGSGCKLVPLGLGYLHASIRDEFDAEIVQLDFDNYINDLIKIIYEKKVDVICFSIYEGMFDKVQKIAKIIKNLKSTIKIIIGGPFPTFASKSILNNYKQFDYVILGEGEKSLKELLRIIQYSPIKIMDIKNIPGIAFIDESKYYCSAIEEIDVNTVPIPSWDVLFSIGDNLTDRFVPICTSRGCFGKCIFCSFDYKRTRKIRSRNLENVKKEIELLINNYDQHEFFFSEPNFLYSRERTKSFINMLKTINGIETFGFTTRVDSLLNCKDLLHDLVELGCRSIELGVESGSESQLKRFKKGVSVSQNEEAVKIILDLKNKVENFVYCIDLILFDPYSTKQEIIETLNFLCKMNLNSRDNELILYNSMNLYEGTLIKKMSIDDKLSVNSIELPYYEFESEDVKEIFNYMFLFMNKIQQKLNILDDLFFQIFNSKKYFQLEDLRIKVNIMKLYNKRNTVVFDYLNELLMKNNNLGYYEIFTKYELNVDNSLTKLSDFVHEL